MKRAYEELSATIGRTPLIALSRKTCGKKAVVLVKQESRNPLGSVKDRVGLAMINKAERDGILKRGITVIEPTSGNTGLALAYICARKGYPLELVMPDSMSVERQKLLQHLGAKLILTPGSCGMKGSIEKASKIAKVNNKYFMPNQFVNPANVIAHRNTTAREIWEDSEGRVDIFVAGVGTGGTITGVGEVLKENKPSVEIVAVEPEDSQVLSGGQAGPHKIQGIGAGFIPDILNRKIIDNVITVSNDQALASSRDLAANEGILCGISSGAAVVAACKLAGNPKNAGKTIITILPDTGERYLSTDLFKY